MKYKNREVKIGTVDRMYYVSYRKYINALESGDLAGLTGNSIPASYAEVNSGVMFRFPFPDEDNLPFGEIIGHHDRGLPVTFPKEKNGKELEEVDILYQKPVYRESDGKFCLALVFGQRDSIDQFRIEDDDTIKRIVSRLAHRNIVSEKDTEKRQFYKTCILRIMEGYGMDKDIEYRKVMAEAKKLNRPKRMKQRRKGKGI